MAHNGPVELGPKVRQFERIVPERAPAREGRVFIRSSSAGSFPKRAAIRECYLFFGDIGIICVITKGVKTIKSKICHPLPPLVLLAKESSSYGIVIAEP
jgi:hypothetical protein